MFDGEGLVAWEWRCRLEKEGVFLTILWRKENIEKDDNEGQAEKQNHGESHREKLSMRMG